MEDVAGLPQRMRERAARIAAGEEEFVPVPLRQAATIALLRDASDGLEVFLMRRQRSMAFAAGMHVYPGGAVEASDSQVPLTSSTDLDAVARRLSTDDPRSIVAAAARETFEECGVLLAVHPDGTPAGLDESFEAQRAQLAAGRLGFGELLRGRGLLVDGEALVPFAHWVTPEVEDRRYDTRFLAARLPHGQEAAERGGEADRVAWVRPADAVAAFEAGTTAMLPPTVATLLELARHPTVDIALEALRDVAVLPLMPAPYQAQDGSLAWRLVDERTGLPVGPVGEPHASETDGAPR
jgi:8-oxo-dGTP pyrophosphatase MutT (NUDIX family)